MSKYIVKRIFFSLIAMIAAAFIAFILVRLTPGDPAEMMLGDEATPELVEAMHIKLGMDKPLIVQFGMFLLNALKGDLGTSIFYKMSCTSLIMQRFVATIQLAAMAMVISLCVSIPLGLIASVKKGSLADFFAMFFALFGQSCSPVWAGIFLILFFGVILGWLPTQGYGQFKHVILPAVTMGLGLSASVTRQLRSAMFDVLDEDYITATYARGISKRTVYLKYALKNALMPVVTVVGVQLAHQLAGSAVVETVFGWPGMGNLLINAISKRDYPLIQANLLLSSIIFIVINSLVDVVYTMIDPRMRLK